MWLLARAAAAGTTARRVEASPPPCLSIITTARPSGQSSRPYPSASISVKSLASLLHSSPPATSIPTAAARQIW